MHDMRERMKRAYEVAVTSSVKAKQRQKHYYDLKTRGAIIQPGDRVLVKIVAYEGKHKIADRWEEEPYIVQSRPNSDIPVYIVKKENGEGRTRTLHRNLLLPIGHLDCFTPQQEQHLQPTQKQQRESSANQTRAKSTRVTRASDSLPKIRDADSDSDDTESIELVVEITEAANPPETTTGQNTSNTAAAGEVDVNRAGDDQPSVASTQDAEDSEDAHSLDTESAGASVHADQVEEPDRSGHEGPSDQDDGDDADDESSGQHDQTGHDSSEEQPIQPGAEHDIGAEGDSRDDDDDDDDEKDDDDGDDDSGEVQSGTRKSSRVSKKPKWMQTGEFALQQQTVRQSDLGLRAECLVSLVNSGVFNQMDKSVSSAIINYVMGIQK